MARAGIVLLLAGVALGGCASTGSRIGKALMPTPLIYQSAAMHGLFEQTPDARRRASIDLRYITDRAAAPSADLLGPYGQGRAKRLAFGSAIVELTPRMPWPELVQASLTHPRSIWLGLELGQVTEIGHYPLEPYPIERTASGRLRRDAGVLERHARSEALLRHEVERRLETAPTGAIMLFVHGFNETFATAAYTAADLCHLRPEDINEGYREVFAKEGNIDLIVYEGRRTDFFGHSYFQSNPKVSSDLIELIRNGTAPGEPGRDLVRLGPVSWRFPD